MGSLVSGWILIGAFATVAAAGALLAILLCRTAARAGRPAADSRPGTRASGR